MKRYGNRNIIEDFDSGDNDSYSSRSLEGLLRWDNRVRVRLIPCYSEHDVCYLVSNSRYRHFLVVKQHFKQKYRRGPEVHMENEAVNWLEGNCHTLYLHVTWSGISENCYS
ncbi:hypothetical protein Lal_00037773 [Lupinus albus]|nr:hypothetical protein Lal_00037773 [Lupinus albus]